MTAEMTSPDTHLVSFTRAVVNLEHFSGWLYPSAPPSVRRGAPPGDAIWFGEIPRQLPGDPVDSRRHSVWFAVRLEGGTVVRAWCDANMNGDIGDDPSPALSTYPGNKPARSFRVTLRWVAQVHGQPTPIERLVRVVVDASDSVGAPPRYRLQDVYGMLGTLEIDGVKRTALLYDGNHDGIYTRGHSDGVFIDLVGDRHFTIDAMAPDFGPFAIPFTISSASYAVDSVALDGSWIMWRRLGPAGAVPGAELGRPAPDCAFLDMEGRFVRLSALRGKTAVLYFWASWCGACRKRADALRSFYAGSSRTDWDLVGICYDTDRDAARRFRSEHGFTWPTSFSGGLPAEDPVGRLYREAGVGVFYVIGPDGTLARKVYEVEDLESALNALRSAPTEPSLTGQK
jgi:peroxiredoxin